MGLRDELINSIDIATILRGYFSVLLALCQCYSVNNLTMLIRYRNYC